MTCEATMLIDFDSIWCTLPIGHEGMHAMDSEGGRFYWVAIK